ncbi:hypothetical protein K491DRAFT_681362 [Lophiostoma macrostomum CBS 122681]|uniref:MYND-type domain-containing protein n=1 Tax=Lophiostoma macrostomum CBS 122681 TaxID=1314788 RepID=A0A6A6SXN4_9PLEO|nr:hypothetical protein K491DRAFT_681362 [Lophiostoma macrostomum CBS 122681]
MSNSLEISSEEQLDPSYSLVADRIITGCAVCDSRVNLIRCDACKWVDYCSDEHQKAHESAHSSICEKIEITQAALGAEDTKLRDHLKNPFRRRVRGFMSYLNVTEDHRRAQNQYLNALLETQTQIATKAALGHMEDMLRLDPKDELFPVKHRTIPALYLRLGQDQQCYDFCRWWLVNDSRGSLFDFMRPRSAIIDTRDSDAFETLEFLNILSTGDHNPSLSLVVAVTLLKIRLLLDMHSLKHTRPYMKLVPPEILFQIQHYATLGDITIRNRSRLEREDDQLLMTELKAQIIQLYEWVHKAKSSLWETLVSSEYRQPTMAEVEEEDSHRVVQYNYRAWAETPLALDVIRAIFKGRGDSETDWDDPIYWERGLQYEDGVNGW